MVSYILVTEAGLDSFKGKDIGEICPCGFDDDDQNHCAHFVSHVLGLDDSLHIGLTCAQMTSKGKKLKAQRVRACLRVDEVFNFCEDIPVPDESGCLISITKLANLKKDGAMGDMPQKRIGIDFKGEVWHYSNTDQEFKRWTKADWISKLDAHYGKHTVVKFTVIPDGATFRTLTQVLALGKTSSK
jgi:hypothetical protein